MEHRVCLVTGATRGLGLETVRQLAAMGHTVYLGCRDLEKGRQVADGMEGDVRAIQLDLDQPETFAAAAKTVEAEFGRLDSLVNNAGVCLEPFGTSALQMSPEAMRKTFEINVFRQVEVTNAFVPLIQKSPSGRIVNLSSILGSVGLFAQADSPIADFGTCAYDMSKTALNSYTVHLAHAFRGTNVKVNAAHPGWVKTDMGGEEAPMDVANGVKTSVDLATLPDDGPTGGYFHAGQPLPW